MSRIVGLPLLGSPLLAPVAIGRLLISSSTCGHPLDVTGYIGYCSAM
jgi:hypothetical protein